MRNLPLDPEGRYGGQPYHPVGHTEDHDDYSDESFPEDCYGCEQEEEDEDLYFGPRRVREQLSSPKDPGYVYTEFERLMWEMSHENGYQLPALRPWSFPAYRGPVARPPRIGVTR